MYADELIMPIFQHWKNPVFTKDSEHNLSFLLSETGKNSPSDWNECELNFGKKHRLPFIDSIKRKMSNTVMFALIKSQMLVPVPEYLKLAEKMLFLQ